MEVSQSRGRKSTVPRQGNLNDLKAACGLEEPVGGRHQDEDCSLPVPDSEGKRPIILCFYGTHNYKIALETLGFDVNLWFVVETQGIYKDDLGHSGQLRSLGGLHGEYVTRPLPYNFHNAWNDPATTITVLLTEILEGFEEERDDDPSMRDTRLSDAVIYSIDTKWISNPKMQNVTDAGRLDTRDLEQHDTSKWLKTSNRQTMHLSIMHNSLRRQRNADRYGSPCSYDSFLKSSQKVKKAFEGVAWLIERFRQDTVVMSLLADAASILSAAPTNTIAVVKSLSKPSAVPSATRRASRRPGKKVLSPR